ncbi:chemoreceptor glutamine deamidase CheD [Psychrobium sp. nBUS_13]|uniref:chemoreceptor glutamine deamidase CheD n=1 Tax=Psychrobium sp. nBUS_13 TaxID=3395319 RepID=UPI003EB9E10A
MNSGIKEMQAPIHTLPQYPEFKHIRQFWMPKRKRVAVKVVAGDFYVSCQDEVICTVLGSCVSTCIRDVKTGVGGINHFLLPDADCDILSSSNRYGVFAMEQLINSIIKYGGRRENFEIKVVGGGNMMAGPNDIGLRNIEFVEQFLKTEGLAVSARDVGGLQARKIQYIAKTGQLMVQKLKDSNNARTMALELENQRNIQQQANDDIELFD